MDNKELSDKMLELAKKLLSRDELENYIKTIYTAELRMSDKGLELVFIGNKDG